MKRLALSLVVLLLGVVAVPLAASTSSADGLDGLVTGEAESFALRVEYDIPLPASPGTIPHTVGEIRRSSAGENAKGLAGAPTHFDAVVGGTYYDPNKNTKGDENLPPQTECFYPGDLVNTSFRFPTDTRAESALLPPISIATAQCGAGPQTELRGAVDAFDAPGVTAKNLESTSLIRATQGVDRAETSAHASAISIAAGAVTIGGVDISANSEVTGKRGGAVTGTRISINDISVSGLRFSIADDRLIVAGQVVPLVGNAAQGVIEQANAVLAASACRIDVITNPGRYPQGFLFSRPNPRVGLAEDGSFAGSMRAGLLVVCDLPQSITGNTDLNPQRVQVVIGFAYAAASATADPGGFGLGNLTGDVGGAGSLSGLTVVAPTLGGDLALAPPLPSVTQPARRAGDRLARPLLPAATTPLNGAARSTLLVVCLVAWASLTHLGITRLRRAT